MKRILLCSVVLFLLCSTTAWAEDYVIGSGDHLSVSVWDVPELSVGVIVRPDGKITLPAVGDIPAAGVTPSVLSSELTEVLHDYVKSPIVTVTVDQVTNNRVYVAGGGVPAHVEEILGNASLFKLLCGIDGVENTDLRRGYIMRGDKKIEIDMYDLLVRGNLENDIDVEPEDILFLPTNELNKVFVVGAVTNPQAIVYRDGLTILDVILESGGFTKFAKSSSVMILRIQGDGRVRIRVNMEDLMEDGVLSENIPMQRGDYVLVREGMF